MRPVNKIVVHCSATPPLMDIGVGKIREWHVKGNKWSDIGYHLVIRRSGKVEEGRPEDMDGAHVRGHNKNTFAVCLVGGVNEKGNPDSNFTRNQWAALEEVVESLLVKYPNAEVVGHRDLDSKKACPSFDVKSWWRSYV